jgi:hypothetical protein
MGAISETAVSESTIRPDTIEEQFSRLARTIEKAPIGIANVSRTKPGLRQMQLVS